MSSKKKKNINKEPVRKRPQNNIIRKDSSHADNKTFDQKKPMGKSAKKEREPKKRGNKKNRTIENNLTKKRKKKVKLYNISNTSILLISFIIIIFLPSIAGNIWTQLSLSIVIATIFSIYTFRNELNENHIVKMIITLTLSSAFALISIQAATPLFMPKISISFGETEYGSVYENYTETKKEMNIDIEAPLLLIKKTDLFNTNCKEYKLFNIKEIKPQIKLDPISINLKTKGTKHPKKYLVICLNDELNKDAIDSWKLRKITIPTDIYSVQDIKFYINAKESETMGKNLNININSLFGDETEYFYSVTIDNWEKFPVRIRNRLTFHIQNNSEASNQLEKLFKRCNSNTIKVFYTSDNKNSNTNHPTPSTEITSYKAPIKIAPPISYIDSETENLTYILHFRCIEDNKKSD